MYVNVRHINIVCIWYYAISSSYGQCSQMVNIQFLTSIHADGPIVADEFLICRLDDWSWYYCQLVGYRVL